MRLSDKFQVGDEVETSRHACWRSKWLIVNEVGDTTLGFNIYNKEGFNYEGQGSCNCTDALLSDDTVVVSRARGAPTPSSDTHANKAMTSRLQKLTAALKRIFNASLRSQYRAGFVNSDSSLTREGKDELLQIVAMAHEEELTARANEVIEEVEEEEDK